MQGIGDGEMRGFFGHPVAPALLVFLQSAQLDQAADDLFHEEGVTLGLGQDDIGQMGGELLQTGQVAGQGEALGRGEGSQPDLGQAVFVLSVQELAQAGKRAFCLRS